MQPTALATIQTGLMTLVSRNDKDELSLRQLLLLLVLQNGSVPGTVTDVATHLDVGKSAITRAMDRLVVLEYAHRAPNSEDARRIYMKPTGKGTRLLRTLEKALARL